MKNLKEFKLCFVKGNILYFSDEEPNKIKGKNWEVIFNDGVKFDSQTSLPFEAAFPEEFDEHIIPKWNIKKAFIELYVGSKVVFYPNQKATDNLFSPLEINNGYGYWGVNEKTGQKLYAGATEEECIEFLKKESIYYNSIS